MESRPSGPYTLHFLIPALARWVETSGLLIGTTSLSGSKSHTLVSYRFGVWNGRIRINLYPYYRVTVSLAPLARCPPCLCPSAFPPSRGIVGQPAMPLERSRTNPRTHPRLSSSSVWSKMVSETVSSSRPSWFK